MKNGVQTMLLIESHVRFKENDYMNLSQMIIVYGFFIPYAIIKF
jgi:hypothetical protein